MLNDIEFIRQSLESDLIYGIGILEMTLDLKISFLPKDKQLQDATDAFYNQLDDLLNEILPIANGNVSQALVNSEIIATKYTLPMYLLTEELIGIDLDEQVVIKLSQIKAGIPTPTDELINKVEDLNNKTTRLIENFKTFLTQVYDEVVNVRLFVFTYGMVIEHMIKKLDLFHESMDRLNSREKFSPTYVAKLQYDFNNLLKDDAQFINGFVNQSESSVINDARNYEHDFAMLSRNYQIPLTPDNQRTLSRRSYELNNSFARFVERILSRMENKNIQFMVEPLFLDFILRESHTFRYILEGNLRELS